MNIRKNLSNTIGWCTNRKIVVFESDDWGSIRTRSKKDYDEMLAKGLSVDCSNFTKFDALESNIDLQNLLGLLMEHKDSTGRPTVFTPMCIMANPDFELIKKTDFKEYHFENFVDTCNRYPNHDRVLNLWRKGIKERLFVPGFHGREHLNVTRWLKALQDGNKGSLTAFEHQSLGATRYKEQDIPEYLGAFHPDLSSEIPLLEEVIVTGAHLFKNNCCYQPSHFIAPNRESPKVLDATLQSVGVKFLTMSKLRHYPLGDEKYSWEFNWLGKKNNWGQIVITRNCMFEPSSQQRNDWVDSCMKEIELAFKWHKPAVINSHRVNYIGSINPENSTKGLRELNRLLSAITKNWPDVEFMTSTDLGNIIRL